MADFKSETVEIHAGADTVYTRLSNLENLRPLLDRIPADRIPEDKREMFDNLTITADSISIPVNAGPVSDLTLRLTDCVEPTLIHLEGVNTPVPLNLSLHLEPINADSCYGRVEIDIALPAMFKPMVSGPLRKVTDQFAQVLGAIKFD